MSLFGCLGSRTDMPYQLEEKTTLSRQRKDFSVTDFRSSIFGNTICYNSLQLKHLTISELIRHFSKAFNCCFNL